MPVLPFLQAGAGLLQAALGFGRAKKAERELERMKSPTYTQNQSILDLYDKALNKYQTGIYDTTQYKKANQDVNRNTAYALDTLRGRGGAVAGVSNIMAGANDSLLKAAANAEAVKRADFSALTNATGMKAAEDRKAFETNQMLPFERKYNLTAMKASGGNKVLGAGLSNIFGGFSAANDLNLADKIYGDNNIYKPKRVRGYDTTAL